jgi:hypothetical protein
VTALPVVVILDVTVLLLQPSLAIPAAATVSH